jgi:hypothetical protein
VAVAASYSVISVLKLFEVSQVCFRYLRKRVERANKEDDRCPFRSFRMFKQSRTALLGHATEKQTVRSNGSWNPDGERLRGRSVNGNI